MDRIEKELDLRMEKMFLKVKEKLEGKTIREIFEKSEKLEKVINPLPSLNFKEMMKMKKQCIDFIITLETLEATRSSKDFESLKMIFEENEIIKIMSEINEKL